MGVSPDTPGHRGTGPGARMRQMGRCPPGGGRVWGRLCYTSSPSPQWCVRECADTTRYPHLDGVPSACQWDGGHYTPTTLGPCVSLCLRPHCRQPGTDGLSQLPRPHHCVCGCPASRSPPLSHLPSGFVWLYTASHRAIAGSQ